VRPERPHYWDREPSFASVPMSSVCTNPISRSFVEVDAFQPDMLGVWVIEIA